MLKILILEDNEDLRAGWLTYFQRQGHWVHGVALAEELLQEAARLSPDVYVIDLNLPDEDGLDVVRRLRSVHPDVVIVITTARSQIGDKIKGYDCGADIYFTKPVEPDELLGSVAALVKRRRERDAPSSSLRLQVERYCLQGPEATVDLTPAETALLAGLVRAAKHPLSRWQLAELLGTGDELHSEGVLEMRITRLRKKLATAGAEPQALRAVHKRGYVLTCDMLLV